MGMHTEVLTGRTQQKFFNPDEAENFYYFGTYDVDFNKRTDLDVKDMSAPEANKEIDNLMSQGYGTIVIKNPQGKHSLGVGILNKLNLIFEGSLGYFGMGSCDGPTVRINGDVEIDLPAVPAADDPHSRRLARAIAKICWRVSEFCCWTNVWMAVKKLATATPARMSVAGEPAWPRRTLSVPAVVTATRAPAKAARGTGSMTATIRRNPAAPNSRCPPVSSAKPSDTKTAACPCKQTQPTRYLLDATYDEHGPKQWVEVVDNQAPVGREYFLEA